MTTSIQLPARRYGPLGSLWIRVGIALGCLLITTVLVYVEREGYRDSNGTPISWLDALYYATVTLSTTGYGDIVPVTEQARLANVLIITPLRFVFLITLVGTTVEVLTQRSRDEFRIKRWRQRMQDHSVIVGFGVKGRAALTTLMEQGTSASDVVVVTHDRISLNAATALGAVGILGDATSEDVLVQALLPRAKRVIVALDRDDTAVLVTLTARRLNPTATIVTSARESQNIDVLRQSGADAVIPTSESAGRMLGLAIGSPAAGHLVEDLLEPAHGLEIVERDITATELGLAPADLRKYHEVVLTVVRDDIAHRFDEDVISVLQRGDRVVVVRPVKEHS